MTRSRAMRRLYPTIVSLLFATLGATAYLRAGVAAEPAHPVPAPVIDEQASFVTSEVVVLAGGCFWGVQGVFQHVDGIKSAVAGYAGGTKETANYETVSSGATGHAESVRVTFDPRRISYGRILQIFFFAAHDPTELDRQGPDDGTQYRSVIFATNPEQSRIAAAYIAQLNRAHVFAVPIVTKIELGRQFYPAEAYHQNYLMLHPAQPYIEINDLSKIEALKELFPNAYRETPVLVAVAQPAH